MPTAYRARWLHTIKSSWKFRNRKLHLVLKLGVGECESRGHASVNSIEIYAQHDAKHDPSVDKELFICSFFTFL